MITIITIISGAVHRAMVHDDDPGMFDSLIWLIGLLQVLLQPSILLSNQIQTVPDKEVELRVNGNDMSWTNVPTETISLMVIIQAC